MTDAFSEEQIEFADVAAKVFAAATRDTVVLDDSAVRTELAEIGLPLLAVPEDLGGLGVDELDAVLIVEEAGYAAVPVPIAETIGVVAPMVARYGTAEQRELWLPALASGRSLGTTLCPSTGAGQSPRSGPRARGARRPCASGGARHG
jgi:alkylation response protein AidB-like acyl-CoA dehydrogenase